MIPAIDPGMGFKEDVPTPSVYDRGNNPAFSRVLNKAAVNQAPGRPGASQSKDIDAAQPSGDPRARNQYGRVTEDAPETDAEKIAKGTPTQLDEAAEQVPISHLKFAGEAQVSLDEDSEDSALAAVALSAVEPEETPAVPEARAPIAAQIGSAAHRLGRHGPAEQRFAQAAGVTLPGSPQAELLQASRQGAKAAVMQESEPDPLAVDRSGTVAREADLLKLSDEASGRVKAPGLSVDDKVKLESAQSRNEIMQRIAAVEEDAAPLQSTAAPAADSLRAQLQLSAALLNSARTAVGKATPGGEQGDTAPAASTGPVNLTQIFQTPTDDAVEQRVIERVAQELRWMLTNERNQVTLKLHPEHLGDLHMRVVQKDGVIRVDLTVDNLAAKQLLESNLDDLRNRLAEESQANGFIFNVDVRKGREQPGLQSQPSRITENGNRAADSLQAATEPGLPRRVPGHTGLSIYV